MTIERNGKIIELTEEEMSCVFEEYQKGKCIEDMKLELEQYAEDIIDNFDFDSAYDTFENLLSKADMYWDTYWSIIDNALQTEIKK